MMKYKDDVFTILLCLEQEAEYKVITKLLDIEPIESEVE
tara:strand:- start:584 stop:700 length:117 start_codon:yes stop_codon:yes gene_type:complete